MPDAIRGKVSINKLFTNSIFNVVWNRIKNDIGLDNLTDSPVEFYQYHKTRMWNLFKEQLRSNDHVPNEAKRSKARFNKFLKSDSEILRQLVLELARIWMIDGNIMNQMFQDMSHPKYFRLPPGEIANEVERRILPPNFRELSRLAAETPIPDEFNDEPGDTFLNSEL
jgi:hypothetical protein